MKNNTIKAKLNGGNIKLGNMMTFSKLYGNDEYKTDYGIVKGSCGGYCAGCKSACYVRKSYRYPSVIKSHARNTLAIRQNIRKAFEDIQAQLSRKRKKADIVRIHQSGEIERPLELLLWIETARKNPDTMFYTYTKNIDALRILKAQIESGAVTVPHNFTVNISVWHDYLLKDFLKDFAQFDFIKAFVYDDRKYDYQANGLNIETYCTAYNQDGKMNHAITCDKCKKCIKSPFKVIGCFDH